MATAPVPAEFTPDAVAAAAAQAPQPYRDLMLTGEPMRSILARNPSLRPPAADEPLEWGKGRYYDTTVGRKHPYWKAVDLPLPTKDLGALRLDLARWGYCVIEDALSSEQCAAMRTRLVDQASGEREAGIAYIVPNMQMVWTLVNKGDVFVGALEHDPAVVQGGPVIEQLLDEALGRAWYGYSFVATIAFPGCHPQALHQDQAAMHPFQTLEAPALVNTMYILQAVDDTNGGTLVIPGSHRVVAAAGTARPVEATLPPAINLEAPAGSAVVFDGRLLHGTGVNRSDEWRYVVTQAAVRPWYRPQENWMLALRPEVVAAASPKLRQRLGLTAAPGYGITEGFGSRSLGRAGDPRGDLALVRRAVDAGTYRRVGELTADTGRSLAPDAFTLQELQGPLGENRAASDPDRSVAVAP
jgi:ectoine hydroxylase-related dioxygenase (phytanoyl-CoA dioxygenase family)